ncbi:MAG: type II toxin-antitoxin system HipA family toxin [Gordonia sp.]|uniref:type II toxin-antitoxin system HipA family toxin n=1 Tax=Gordonia sp. (in: high G+C Gram-positive bacteria) TaxID=84139 RepID=UPI001D874BA0|nr:HipA domain-containing protein [Gordonia sp. (in: high G+C Gram-positive bacteria)]MCB1294143.1 type II toxin-antitoxin system HipA family toxin [Gordonia sp. (in: high G+C Gram-positive bacteria)]HQV17441.1 HipA domain-containing protein [Gordonia sp. (in: high G+C Gram-positive bacteria)]
MTSTSEAFVWVWLPGSAEPVPAGRLELRSDGLWFGYGRGYLARHDAISLAPSLPLTTDEFGPDADLGMPGALRDGAPDAWGRRVILHALTDARGRDVETGDLTELTYLLASGSNRLGAIDFQASATRYVSRTDTASLDELGRAAQIVDEGGELPVALASALVHGTSMGGAHPKALIADGDTELLAKFSTSDDILPVVKAEAASIELARHVGLDVPAARLVRAAGRDALLIERFDRPGGGRRIPVVSALTLSGLGEMTARYGSYVDLLASLRESGSDAGEELFRRVAFNIAISNTDDHLRNHAAFWDGRALALTPAYDLSPMSRTGETASQAIAYGADGQRDSNLATLVRYCGEYGLSRRRGHDVAQAVVTAIHDNWDSAADVAQLTQAERAVLLGRQFLNPGSIRGL